jgi:hypothetical protein
VFADPNATGIFRDRAKASEWLGLTTETLNEPGAESPKNEEA